MSGSSKPLQGIDADAVVDARARVLAELDRVLLQVDAAALAALLEILLSSRRIFVHAAGRSALALRMSAMRWMHIGLSVHVVGDATTPAIAAGDVLVLASGSGRTAGVVRAAEQARGAGARIAAVTADADSVLAKFGDSHLLIPAATKQDGDRSRSVQYAGSLFEQAVLLIFDIAFEALWKGNSLDAAELWQRHANLE
jgi:6-phospho-3-hexuloisomerase